MRRATLRIAGLLGIGSALLLAGAAAAGSPAASGGAGWDDRHMRSNVARRFEGEIARPPVMIDGREAAAAPAPTHVEEQLLSLSQHPWQRGVTRLGNSTSWGRPTALGERSAADGARTSRSSSIRGGAVSNGTQGRLRRR